MHDDDTVDPYLATLEREGNDVLQMPKSATPQDGKRLHNTAFAVNQEHDHKLIATTYTTILHNAEEPIHNQAAAAACFCAEITQRYTAAHTPETADVAFRRAESQPNEAGQVRPSVPAAAENFKKWSTIGGVGTAAAQGNRQPAQRRCKVIVLLLPFAWATVIMRGVPKSGRSSLEPCQPACWTLALVQLRRGHIEPFRRRREVFSLQSHEYCAHIHLSVKQ